MPGEDVFSSPVLGNLHEELRLDHGIRMDVLVQKWKCSVSR